MPSYTRDDSCCTSDNLRARHHSTGCHLGWSWVGDIKYTQISVLLLWIDGIMKKGLPTLSLNLLLVIKMICEKKKSPQSTQPCSRLKLWVVPINARMGRESEQPWGERCCAIRAVRSVERSLKTLREGLSWNPSLWTRVQPVRRAAEQVHITHGDKEFLFLITS